MGKIEIEIGGKINIVISVKIKIKIRMEKQIKIMRYAGKCNLLVQIVRFLK